MDVTPKQQLCPNIQVVLNTMALCPPDGKIQMERSVIHREMIIRYTLMITSRPRVIIATDLDAILLVTPNLSGSCCPPTCQWRQYLYFNKFATCLWKKELILA